MQSWRIHDICTPLSFAEMLDELHLSFFPGFTVGQKMHSFPEAPQVPTGEVLLWVLVNECWKREREANAEG